MVDWVIKAMGYGDDQANEAIRLSWCHLTPEVDCPPSGQPECVLRTVKPGRKCDFWIGRLWRRG
jgi:hypothetical protein